MTVDDDETPAFGHVQADEETGIRFLVDNGILVGRCPKLVAQHLGGAVIFIQHGVEDVAIVPGPCESAGGAGNFIWQQLTACHVFDADGVDLGALRVLRVGE